MSTLKFVIIAAIICGLLALTIQISDKKIDPPANERATIHALQEIAR